MRNTKNWMADWDKESHIQLANLAVATYMRSTRFTEFPDGAVPTEGVVDLDAEEFNVNDINAAIREDIRENGFAIGDCTVQIIGDTVRVNLFRSYLSMSREKLSALTDEVIFLQARIDERQFMNMQEYLLNGVLKSSKEDAAAEDVENEELEG